jgi:hypothetical protein
MNIFAAPNPTTAGLWVDVNIKRDNLSSEAFIDVFNGMRRAVRQILHTEYIFFA